MDVTVVPAIPLVSSVVGHARLLAAPYADDVDVNAASSATIAGTRAA